MEAQELGSLIRGTKLTIKGNGKLYVNDGFYAGLFIEATRGTTTNDGVNVCVPLAAWEEITFQGQGDNHLLVSVIRVVDGLPPRLKLKMAGRCNVKIKKALFLQRFETQKV